MCNLQFSIENTCDFVLALRKAFQSENFLFCCRSIGFLVCLCTCKTAQVVFVSSLSVSVKMSENNRNRFPLNNKRIMRNLKSITK